MKEAQKKITTIEQVPLAFAFYLWSQGMTHKERKSLAKIAGMSYGIFDFKNKGKMQSELGILYAYLGSNLLRLCLSSMVESGEIDNNKTVESMIETFEVKFFSCFVYSKGISTHIQRYKDRTLIWDKIGVFDCLKEANNVEEYYNKNKDISFSFYEYLTGRIIKDAIDEQTQLWVFSERIRNYTKLFMSSLEEMLVF